MIKSHAICTSMGLYTEDIRNSIIRGQKYFRAVKQFNEDEDVSNIDISLFFKKVKKVKMIKSFKFQVDFCLDTQIRLERVKMALKAHSQKLQEVDISTIFSSTSNQNQARNMLYTGKNLRTVEIPNDPSCIRNLLVLRKLENLFINMTNDHMKTDLLCNVLCKLRSLKNLCVEVSPSSLDQVASVLNKFSAISKQQIEYQILVKEEQNYSASDFNVELMQKVKKLSLKSLDSKTVVQKFFGIQPSLELSNLKTLKLGFNTSDLHTLSYLSCLDQIPVLENLSLSFPQCWDINFIEGIFENLHFPVLLQELKLVMPLSFRMFLVKYIENNPIGEGQKKNNVKYPWRKTNFFEEEPLFFSFFDALEKAHYLKKIEFCGQFNESFSSHYTNFFVSILNRLPSLSSFAFHISDYTFSEDFVIEAPEPFDLGLLLQACSQISHLKAMEIYMPNLLFEDAEINYSMAHLKSFTVGVVEKEEKVGIQFQNISKPITKWLKKLLSLAPTLSVLVLDFTEVIDEPTFCRRFMLIERFKQLEAFCSKFVLEKCSIDTAIQVGKTIQDLQKLNSLVLRFFESDRNVLEMRKYINYMRRLRDVLVSFDEKNWLGKNDDTEMSSIDFFNEDSNCSPVSSLDDEAISWM